MLRRLILFAALTLGLAPGAQAQLSPLLDQGSVLRPSVSVDFENGKYGGGCNPIANCVTVTRASAVATDLTYFDLAGASFTTYAANTPRIKAGWGLLKEDNRTNFLLNSGVPATQTTGALANTLSWLWVNGPPGSSAALSNGTATGCVGTATQGFPVSFTPTAGTCTVTVSGSLNQFQLEQGAASPTSYIATAGATVARGTESIATAGNLATVLGAKQGFEVISTLGIQTGVLLNRNSGSTAIFAQVITSNGIRAFSNAAITAGPNITGLAGINSTGAPNKVATSWGGRGVSIAWNNGPTVRSGVPFTPLTPNLEIGGTGTTASINDFVRSIVAGNYQPSDASLRNGTTAWAPMFLGFQGDSITVGFGSSNPYPNQLMALLPRGQHAWPYKNSAVTGQGATTVVALWDSQTAPFIDHTIPNCTMFQMAGTNNISGGTAAATVEVSEKQMWALSKANHCYTIASTITIRTGSLAITAQAYEALRLQLNALIRADSAFYDGLNDVGADTHMGVPTEFTASITTTNMTVSAMISGTIQFGNSNAIFGPNIAANTSVTSQTSGTPGGVGVYVVSISQSAASGDVIEQPDLTYFQADGTHPTAAGDTIIAADAYTATAGILH